MRNSLWNYIREYKEKTFQEHPFNPVDALLLSQLAYLKMDGIIPGFQEEQRITLKQLSRLPRAETLFKDPVYGPMYQKIFAQICDSRRYQRIQAAYFMKIVNHDPLEHKDCHFAAVTFKLGENSTFVAYRGTDETIGSWKEDLNMACQKQIPSQNRAVGYLKGVARRTKGTIITAGHSKGGNLAVFSAAMVPDRIRKRIARIYDFDGVGFRTGFYRKKGYQDIRDRILKLVPQQSVFGLLMGNDPLHRVVGSYRRGIQQHDLMNWKIQNGKFLYVKGVTAASKRLGEKLNHWIDALSEQEIRNYIQCLYKIAGGERKLTVYEMNLRDVLRNILEFLLKEEPDTKQMFLCTTGKLLGTVQ